MLEKSVEFPYDGQITETMVQVFSEFNPLLQAYRVSNTDISLAPKKKKLKKVQVRKSPIRGCLDK